MTETIELKPVYLWNQEPAEHAEECRRLGKMLDDYAFGLIQLRSGRLYANLCAIERAMRGLMTRDPRDWMDVVTTWPREKNGQLGPTDEAEERHPGKAPEIKRYVSVDGAGRGWHGDELTTGRIRYAFAGLYEIGVWVARIYEDHCRLADGTLSALLSADADSFTTMRLNWYPPNGGSSDHTDTCAITVLPFKPGLQIEYPKKSGRYVKLTGGRQDTLVINLGDTFSGVLHGVGAKSTRHRVVMPDDIGPEGRVTTPLFIHTHKHATFPDGTNIRDWCAGKFEREGAAANRIAGT